MVKPRKAKIYYAKVDEFWTRKEKYQFLTDKQHLGNIEWQLISPDKNYTWLTEGLRSEFETFIPLGNKEAKAAKSITEGVIFKLYSRGVATCRDAWVYNFQQKEVERNTQSLIDTYNEQLVRWHNSKKNETLDNFLTTDDSKISWSSSLKDYLKRGIKPEFDSIYIRESIYRPFTRTHLYFNTHLNERRYQLPKIFPTRETEKENQVICVNAIGSSKSFHCLIVNLIPDLHLTGDSQCFPFYTYSEEGKNRTENITSWALNQFITHYQDNTITKWDIFYYIYALLHHPEYRSRYSLNLRRQLPHIPFTPNFWIFSHTGRKLADLHLNYSQQPEYNLTWRENNDYPLNWRVDKMKLSKDKTQIIYNDFLTLCGIPKETYNYRLGNRSVLEWIIDQYRVKVDKRSGITNDPNRLEDEEYIVRLVGKIITVSLETVKLIESLPGIE